MADKGIGSRILGTFFESKEPTGEKSVEDQLGSKEKSPAELMAELVNASNPNAAPPPAPAAAPSTPPPYQSPGGAKVTHFPAIGSGAAGPAAPSQAAAVPEASEAPATPQVAPANVNFEAIFRDAGMDVAELDRVKKAEELLRNLPPETPLSLQKTIVETSLKAFGFEIAKIVGASQNQMKAIDTFVKVGDTSMLKGVADAEAQIKSLNDKIAALKADIEKRTLGQAGLLAAAQIRKAQIQKVLDFFEPPKPV